MLQQLYISIYKKRGFCLALILLSLWGSSLCAQNLPVDIEDDDMNIGGDIFSDFNEDLDQQKILDDERFYRYGRYYSFQIGLGYTGFAGNRGAAYENEIPSYGLSLNVFSDFQNSFGLGFAYSKHHFFLDEPTLGYSQSAINQDVNGDGEINSNDLVGVGMVDVSLLRLFFAYRHYFDTANLGTAITYANPYITGRLEYWYLTNTFVDVSNEDKETGGGFGFGLGGGLEFPIVMKESYINVELIIHSVNLPDKYTQKYRAHPNSTTGFGYDDFTGMGYSLMFSYVLSW